MSATSGMLAGMSADSSGGGESVFRLIYVSRESSPMSRSELDGLLCQARSHNRRAGITGLLVHKAGHFLQVLEGERDDVEGLMVRIQNDLRHREVTVLTRDEPVERHFGEWAMALADWPDEDAKTSAAWFDVLETFRAGGGHFSPGGCLLAFVTSLAQDRYLH